MDNTAKTMAIVSLVLGIVSIIFGIPIFFIGLACGVVGIILATMSKKREPSGMATAGLVLSIIGLILSAIIVISVAACAGAAIMGGNMLMDMFS